MRLMPWVEELDENSVNHFEPEDRRGESARISHSYCLK